MVPRALEKRPLVAAVAFVAAVLVLAVQLITPSPVMVSVGDGGAEATQLGQYFTYSDVAVIAVAAFVCGTSGTYLALHDREDELADPDRSPADGNPAYAAPEANSADGVGTAGPREGPDREEDRRERWEEVADRLKNNEETIYSMLVDADGELAQRELVEETDLSKATVSRTLDKLENRGLVQRRRNGMGNTVHLR